MASSSDLGGRIVGMRFASIVLPAPGGPMNMMLCTPAHATASARLAACCPCTSRRSTEYCAASESICRASTLMGVNDSGEFTKSNGLRQRLQRKNVHAFYHCRLLGVCFRHRDGLQPKFPGCERRRKCTAHRPNASVQR